MKTHSISLPVSVAVVTVVLLAVSFWLGGSGGAKWYGEFLSAVVLCGFLGLTVPIGLYRCAQKRRSLPNWWLIASFGFAVTFAFLAYIQVLRVPPLNEEDKLIQQAALMAMAGLFPSAIFWMAVGGIPFLEKRVNAIAVESEQPSLHTLASSLPERPQVTVCFFATGRLTVDLATPVIGVPVQVRIGSTVIDISNETAT